MKNINAFTLVELAIVVIIIGLLAGGVLAGQELIKQASIQSMIKDIESYKSAMTSYKGKYNFGPGDDPSAYNYFGNSCDANASYCNGNGNGILEDTYNINTNDNEAKRFWQHLTLSKFIKGSYTGVGPRNVSVPTVDFPSVFVTAASGVPNASSNYFLVGYNNIYQTAEGPFLFPDDSYAIDIKYDDGKPNTGKIITYYDSWTTVNMPNCKAGSGVNATYNMGFASKACHMVFAW